MPGKRPVSLLRFPAVSEPRVVAPHEVAISAVTSGWRHSDIEPGDPCLFLTFATWPFGNSSRSNGALISTIQQLTLQPSHRSQ